MAILRVRAHLSPRSLKVDFKITSQYAEQARWIKGPARLFGISAKNCILPLLQLGQTVRSMPVSRSMISSTDSVTFSGKADNPINCRMEFRFSVRFRLARNHNAGL
jgi:hypothetical protein